jgi:hypothetical protein
MNTIINQPFPPKPSTLLHQPAQAILDLRRKSRLDEHDAGDGGKLACWRDEGEVDEVIVAASSRQVGGEGGLHRLPIGSERVVGSQLALGKRGRKEKKEKGADLDVVEDAISDVALLREVHGFLGQSLSDLLTQRDGMSVVSNDRSRVDARELTSSLEISCPYRFFSRSSTLIRSRSH